MRVKYKMNVRTKKEEKTLLADVLKKIRGETPQDEYAFKHGVKPSNLKNWEQGRTAPRLDQALALMRALGGRGLKMLGYDPGDFLGAIRGKPENGSSQLYEGLGIILEHAPETVKDKIAHEITTLAGKYGSPREVR